MSKIKEIIIEMENAGVEPTQENFIEYVKQIQKNKNGSNKNNKLKGKQKSRNIL